MTAAPIIEIHRTVARIEEMVRGMKEQADKREVKDDENERRLRTVENRQHYWSGGGTIVGLIAGYFAQKLHLGA